MLQAMADVFSIKKRSEVMSRIRSRGNATTEMTLARALRRERISGWRRHVKLPGSPDFFFRKNRLCVFVHGCFWHGCPNCYRKPTSNKAYWSAKVLSNRRRDSRVRRKLSRKGFRTMTIWECQIAGSKLSSALQRIIRALKQT